MKANIIEEVGLLLYNSCKNIREAFPLQFEYQLRGKHWPSPNPYKKNRVSFSILRQIVRSPFSSADTYVNQMKKRNSEKLERWAQEISLTSLTICLFSLTKQAIRLAPSSTNVSWNFQSHDRGKQELNQMVYHQNRTCVYCYLSIEQCKVAPSTNMYT